MEIGQIVNSATKSASWTDTSSAANAVGARAAVKNAAPVMTASAVQETDATVPEAQLGEALQSINKALQSMSSNLQFSVDDESNRTIVKVVDQETKEVIRQLPSKEALEISKALDKLQGLLLDSKA